MKKIFSNPPVLSKVVVFVLSFALFNVALAAEGDISSALSELGATVGQEISSKEQAAAVCDQEKYFEICANIGKKHQLYKAEVVKQVDAFIGEIKGEIAEYCADAQR